MTLNLKKSLPYLAAAAVLIGGFLLWRGMQPNGPGDGFIQGNGRIEATEIDVATKMAGRLQDILIAEGDFVEAGQVLGHMQVDTLNAQLEEARAQHQQAVTGVSTAEAQVKASDSDRQAAEAVVAQHASELDAAKRRLARTETLSREGAASAQELDDDRARVNARQATLTAARAQAVAAQAAVDAARARVIGAQSLVAATEATIRRIEADLADNVLKAPRDGRVQFRVAQPGEVLGAGGKVLNLIDLSDVYMTFFVPEAQAGRVAIGSEARLILDAAPDYVIPARISFVSSTAQFTPKTVETASEREKLMFRVRAQIDPELLRKHIRQVKTGLPGVAWLKLDADAEWPEQLAVRLPQ